MTTTPADAGSSPKRIETIVRGVLQRDGQVLLCRDREGGYCYLPGGHVEPGEASSAALARELLEEAGLTSVEIGPCVLVTEERFIQSRKARHELNIVFHVERCVLADGTPLPLGTVGDSSQSASGKTPPIASREEHIEFLWLGAAELSDVDLRPKSIKAWLLGGPEGLDRPGWISRAD